ncbi:TonB-dependent receptor [Kordiimonas marina]|uniref:TonB-dependent receptor n=1 Tax=Kordiimonas marina TaxID=2872312 RepID=UPI001FF4D227|nr:TonB-dependent receptor [Kordiimonas marina]MCJ9428084.1 TonB-dependent receptor [Kordiimonas marina]
MATVMGASVSVMAQDTQSTKKDKAGFGLEEIVVTAQKREATLLETPVAVSALTGASMEKAQIRDLTAMQTLMPSLAVTQRASASNTSFSIRGIGSSTFNFGIEPAVGVFVDGVYRSRNGASVNDFLGIQRVEVLRGPQSTLFGKNTSAGVINIITQEPTYEPFVEGEFTYGNYNATVAKAAVNLPAIEDKLAFRLDANLNKRDGIFTNDDGRKLNERNRYGLRGQMLFEPNDRTKLRIIADYNKLDEECCAAPFYLVTDATQQVLTVMGSKVQGAHPFSGNTHINGAVKGNVENWGVSGQLDLDFDTFSVTSITAYRDYKEKQNIDADFSDLQLNKYRTLDQSYNTFTQELRVTSKTSGPIDWMAGVYYYKQNLSANNSTVQGAALRPFADLLTGNAITNLEAGLGLPSGTFLADGSGQLKGLFNQDNQSYSGFVQLDWHLNDKLTLTGGLRYTSEKKSMVSDIVINDPFAALNMIDLWAPVFAGGVQAQLTAAGYPAAYVQAATAQAYANAAAVKTVQSGGPQTDPLTPTYNPLLGLTALQFFPPASNVDDSFTDNELSGNLIANYEMSDQVTMYASYSRGFKAGGYALDSAAVRVGSFKFNKEVTTSYELGMKARLMDRRMSLDFALFDEKIKGFQENIFTGSSFVPGNVDAAVQGLEFDGKFQATPELLLTAGFTWLWKAEYQNYTNGPCPAYNTEGCTFVANDQGVVRPVQDLSGVRLSEVPKFTGNVTATYSQPINDDLEYFVRGELYYKGDQRLSVAQDARQKQNAYALVGASFGLGRQDQNWSLQLWARNLLNEHYVLDTFDSTIPGGSLNAYIGDPRTYGVTLRVKY